MVDGLLNINVDTLSKSIISYGDSAFVPTAPCKSGSTPALKQFFFGAAPAQDESKRCTVSAREVVEVDAVPIDPRLAMAQFLLQAAPGLLADHESLDDLVNTISVSHSFDGDSSKVQLLNVPGAVEDVPAKLSYVQREDGSLALTWSFEYQTNENWYEAHISAAQDAKDVATPLLVVDVSPLFRAKSSDLEIRTVVSRCCSEQATAERAEARARIQLQGFSMGN